MHIVIIHHIVQCSNNAVTVNVLQVPLSATKLLLQICEASNVCDGKRSEM